jgi:hypothetical protein
VFTPVRRTQPTPNPSPLVTERLRWARRLCWVSEFSGLNRVLRFEQNGIKPKRGSAIGKPTAHWFLD